MHTIQNASSLSSHDAHNIIGLVNAAYRIKINLKPPGKSAFRLADLEWHNLKVTYDASSSRVEAFLDDTAAPILTAVDRTLGHGIVGIGSFDDSGYFDDFKLRGIEKRTEF